VSRAVCSSHGRHGQRIQMLVSESGSMQLDVYKYRPTSSARRAVGSQNVTAGGTVKYKITIKFVLCYFCTNH
jgi:hypothetical protein